VGAAEKSVSREHTFAEDESNRDAVRETLLELVEEVGRRFRGEERWARTAKLKLRDAAFNTFTRQSHFDLAARDDITFRHKALELFDAEWPEKTILPSGRETTAARRKIRLIGFGVTDIVDAPEDPEPTLFGPDPRVAERIKRERLSAALDALHAHPRRTERR
jgi:DNA polymerase-4